MYITGTPIQPYCCAKQLRMVRIPVTVCILVFAVLISFSHLFRLPKLVLPVNQAKLHCLA